MMKKESILPLPSYHWTGHLPPSPTISTISSSSSSSSSQTSTNNNKEEEGGGEEPEDGIGLEVDFWKAEEVVRLRGVLCPSSSFDSASGDCLIENTFKKQYNDYLEFKQRENERIESLTPEEKKAEEEEAKRLEEEQKTTKKDEQESAETSDCSMCKFFRDGPCRKQFLEWDKCVRDNKDHEEGFVGRCTNKTVELETCLQGFPYYDSYTYNTVASNYKKYESFNPATKTFNSKNDE